MQFLYYLSANSINIIAMMRKLDYTIAENTAICRDVDVYGALIADRKRFVVCTKNMIARGEGNYKFDETVYHEGAHVVHACLGGPIGIPRSKMNLNEDRKEIVQYYKSTWIDKTEYQEEYEAYWLEDKPKLVESYITKYCF